MGSQASVFSLKILFCLGIGVQGEKFSPLAKDKFYLLVCIFFRPNEYFLHLSSLFFDVEVDPLAVIRSHCFRAVRTYAPLRFAGLVGDCMLNILDFIG